ncbi:hypothetical protein BH23CHL9_BH23CHL9_12950 [soil metagenome]
MTAAGAWRRRLPLGDRSRELELLDRGLVRGPELATNLADLARLNRLPGGRDASLAAVARLLDGRGTARVLDVGTGGADLPLAFARHGWDVVALDHDPDVLAIARAATAHEPHIDVVEGDGGVLPFDNGSFDVAHASLLLHHLDPGVAVAHLRELRRVARIGVVVNDLRRGMLPLLATGVSVALLGRCRTTRHDGLLSARRAYTTTELNELLRRSGLAVVFRSAAWMPRVVTAAVPADATA